MLSRIEIYNRGVPCLMISQFYCTLETKNKLMFRARTSSFFVERLEEAIFNNN